MDGVVGIRLILMARAGGDGAFKARALAGTVRLGHGWGIVSGVHEGTASLQRRLRSFGLLLPQHLIQTHRLIRHGGGVHGAAGFQA